MDGSLVFLIVVAGAIYIIPSLVAFFRNHPNRWVILVLNIAGGMTVLGWLLALIWSFQAVHKSPKTIMGTGTDGGESGLNIFANDEQRVVVSSRIDKTSQLQRLKELLDGGAISEEEFALLKADVLDTAAPATRPRAAQSGRRYI